MRALAAGLGTETHARRSIPRGRRCRSQRLGRGRHFPPKPGARIPKANLSTPTPRPSAEAIQARRTASLARRQAHTSHSRRAFLRLPGPPDAFAAVPARRCSGSADLERSTATPRPGSRPGALPHPPDEKGKAYGEITAKALAVLEALLWGFHNAKSGLASRPMRRSPRPRIALARGASVCPMIRSISGRRRRTRLATAPPPSGPAPAIPALRPDRHRPGSPGRA